MNRWPALVLLLLACTPTSDREANSVAGAPTRTDAGVGPPAADEAGFSTRVAVFLLADSTALEAIRVERTEEEFHAVADDLMWYRAEAWSWLDEHGVRVVAREGRSPLRFYVDGAMRAWDFGGEPAADVVVLYEPGREPRALAPVDVTAAAPAYFGLEPR